MVFRMVFEVDGGCRNNGKARPIGAAACLRLHNPRWLRASRPGYAYRTRPLPRHPTPTNQKAELMAVSMALEWAIERYMGLKGSDRPEFRVTIRTDSKYVVGCMTEWIHKWRNNNWRNARGQVVANRDLIARAAYLDAVISDWGTVQYTWIPRSENEDADERCNEALDEQYAALASSPDLPAMVGSMSVYARSLPSFAVIA